MTMCLGKCNMDPAVDKLEALFQKAESDLNYISLRLETEFSQQFAESGQDELNPITLLERVNKAKMRFKSLSEEIVCIYSKQEEIQDGLRKKMLACQGLLRDLQQGAGLSVLDITADEQLLQGLEIRLRIDTASSQQSSDEEEKENKNTENQVKADTQQSAVKPNSRGRKEFIPINETEYLSVSDLVRGRAKRQDVNKVYEVLFQHFKKNKNSPSLTPKEMTKMGLKVTGATGEAKLKVVRLHVHAHCIFCNIFLNCSHSLRVMV
ncbi:spindle and kinetochore-associated protein 2-like isoform X2 [Montipora capricornis]|uniref:spindle and kinetochore-associated protein 2-like isoform X2 n=1 Tax=Montipora capricornis TaxID=246305 RepID=UPI0035F21AC3